MARSRGRHRRWPVSAAAVTLAFAGACLAAPAVLSAPGSPAGAGSHLSSSGSAVPVRAATRRRLLVSDARVRAARRYARSRAGHVAFAVLEGSRRIRGWRRTHTFASASLSKAMLLVATLRRAGRHAVTPWERALLALMITASDNDAASAVYNRVGGAGMLAVARAAGMRRFHDIGYWSDAVLTPADQVRLFARIDRLVPSRHRRYLRRLLRSVIAPQRWGIAAVADHRGWKVLFKGGWRTGLANQSALVEHDGRRVAISVLTDHDPSTEYGYETIRGVAQRLIGRWNR